MNQMLSHEIVQECQKRLLKMKQDLMNRAKSVRQEFSANDKNSGDEIDQTVAHLAEHHFLVTQERLRFQIMEINYALSRIESGRFGLCEETEELIEVDRLLAIPYTRLSIEGAEIRESAERKFARL